jgi:hypothetical protein
LLVAATGQARFLVCTPSDRSRRTTISISQSARTTFWRDFLAKDAAIGQPSQQELRVRATDVAVSGRRRPITPKTAEQPSAIAVDLVGLAEAAELAGIGRAALSLRRQQHPNFPEPLAELRCGPIWFRWQIETYLAEERQLGRRGWYGRRVTPAARRS